MRIALALVPLIVSSGIVSAQIPTEAQKQALRANCVKDFRHNCSGVPTGGMAALVCLEEHVDKLSSGCKTAVRAVQGAPASTSDQAKAAATETKPTTAEAKPEPKTTAAPETPAKAAAPAPAREPLPFFQEVRIAARSCAADFRKLCPNVPLGHGNAIFCLKVHAPKLDPACRKALTAAGEALD